MDEYVCIINPNLTFRPVEPIVRCRDCFFAEDGGRLCNHFLDECDDGPALVEPDGFCAWGEERGER